MRYSNMNKELPLVVKAMGKEVDSWVDEGIPLVRKPGIGYWKWDPLTSAEDFLEMEIAMSVSVKVGEKEVEAYVLDEDAGRISVVERFSDHYSRKMARVVASVKLVAALGRQLGSTP